ncbi:hypothetical protein [Salinibaculum rarum]|uniref:hypothetical protein n=1 Tax=Salinibaculum rarum TaxID=3058903 RepID=UPI00265FEF3D|nr:hypothetical protein [Salinibaculum sp. KK48]
MNPRTDYEDADPQTARAFFELFKRHTDDFSFGIDNTAPEDEELRAHLTPSNHTTDTGRSTFTVTAINNQESFENIAETVQTLGLSILEEVREERTDETIGNYKSDVITAYAPQNLDAEWNVPHLVVYGSLTPEFEEAIQEAVGTQFNITNVRNHVLISGDSLTHTHCTRIADTVQDASYFFEDDRQHVISNLHTAALC